jgi:hypothetical protein
MDKEVADVTAYVLPTVQPLDLRRPSTTGVAPLDSQAVLQEVVMETATLVATQYAATLAYVQGQVRIGGLDISKITDGEVIEAFGRTLTQFAEHASLGTQPAAGRKTLRLAVDRAQSFVTVGFAHPTKPIEVERTVALLGHAPFASAEALERIRISAIGLIVSAEAYFQTAVALQALKRQDESALSQGWQHRSKDARECKALAWFPALGLTSALVFVSTESNGIRLGDTFLVTATEADAVSGCITSCVTYVEGVLATNERSKLGAALTAAIDQPPSKRQPIDETVGKIVADLSRADGAAILIGGRANLSDVDSIAASHASLSSRTSGGRGSGTAFFCEKGLVIQHQQYGTIGPFGVGELEVFNPPDTSSPIVISVVAASGWYAGMQFAVMLRASSFARREFLNTALPKWREGGTSSATEDQRAAASASTAVANGLPASLTVPLLHATGRSTEQPLSKLVLSRSSAVGDIDPFPAPPPAAASAESETTGGALADEDPESEERRVDQETRRAIAAAAPHLTLAVQALHCPPPGIAESLPTKTTASSTFI